MEETKKKKFKKTTRRFSMVTKIDEFKDSLSSKGVSGLALDIDETLSYTLLHWVEQLQINFGNPEKLTVKELIQKYRYMDHVPYWQTTEALEWMQWARTSNKLQAELPLIENSNIAARKIDEIIPISLYLTVRPMSVVKGTVQWLTTHNFPVGSLMLRPDGTKREDGNKWKAEVLEILFPEIGGIVDDNSGLVKNLSSKYKGVVYLYNYDESPRQDINVIPCKNWGAVLTQIKKSS